MPTTTITSKSVVSYNEMLKVADDVREEMFNQPEFKALILYRKFDFHNDNLVGDLNRATYNDYYIYAIVNILLVDDRIVNMGEALAGDCEVFLKPYIDYDYEGNKIEIGIVPEINDEIVFNNIRYRIKLIRPERIGTTITYIDCLCSRLENNNPTTNWNENYNDNGFL